MKKLLLLLLLVPFSINAKASINATINCQDEIKIGNKINCSITLDNNSKKKIKNVFFNINNNLQDIKSDFDMTTEEDILKFEINSEDKNFKLFSFNYLFDKNNTNILIENMEISMHDTPENIVIENVSKILTISNIAYADQIYINNQPIPDMNRDTFNYSINLYEVNEYIEIKVVTSGRNKTLDDEIRLIRYTPTFSLKVTNEIDTETYNLTFSYKNAGNVSEISIDEIPFYFNPNKKYYYFEVENDVSKISIKNSENKKDYNLSVGKNNIKFDNNGEIYSFVINRLKSNEKINEDSSLKSIKVGNNYLNLKKEVYKYDYMTDKVELVTIETTNNQDYEIKYNSDKVTITVYDAKLNKSEYLINFIKDDETKKEIREYDNTKAVIIFFIFLLSFFLMLIIFLRKLKKERIN